MKALKIFGAITQVVSLIGVMVLISMYLANTFPNNGAVLILGMMLTAGSLSAVPMYYMLYGDYGRTLTELQDERQRCYKLLDEVGKLRERYMNEFETRRN